VFAPAEVDIQHVGSTAVPGLGAKPIIDMMVGVEDLLVVERRIAAIEALDYGYMPNYEEFVPERRFFRKPREGEQHFHLHCVCTDTEFFRDHIVFRDALRHDPNLAAEYLALKQELAEELRTNRLAYTDAKTEFISGVLAAAYAAAATH
jgi:GrpB-like predicted nucleotidyltransferase (UPF0157 family)